MEIKLSNQILRSVADDPRKSAEAANLIYVTDAQSGILRKRKGNHFVYYYGNREVTDPAVLKRIASLVIPPAWSGVWICPEKNGHLQVTGTDALSRKQYRYHPRWIALRGQTKFYRLKAFGLALPGIRKQLKADLARKGLSLRKVLAMLVSIMEQTNIRIGNDFYERLYGSYGLATLQCRHVKLKGGHIRFLFTGKKGVRHDISIRNKKLATIISRCKEIPGKHLFQYYDENEQPRALHSGDINDYIREISGSDFSSKDFRTWAGSTGFIRGVLDTADPGTPPTQKELVSLVDRVAESLGNTRSVCRKYYIHPRVIALFENGTLRKKADRIKRATRWMSREERILLKIL